MINQYILAWGLTFGQPVGEVLPQRDAPRMAAKALIKYHGLDNVVSRWEKRHLKLDKYPELAYIGVVGRVVTEKRITYTWNF